jgi:multidrug efflux pump subunit AcrA (membrane-fusion protein)
MKAIKTVLLVFLGSIVLTGCGTSSGTAATSDSSARAKAADSLRKVTTVTAVEMPLEQLIVVTGTLAAEQEIILGMKVAGRISD